MPSCRENNKSALRSHQEDPEPVASADTERGVKYFSARGVDEYLGFISISLKVRDLTWFPK